ncbi:hypothetical protein GCM10009550_38920 [Actinocorallia libanotica]|uniref:Dioxygenase n=2 Tax=Actinocorallia libanotica TaxID=46162 RepID=A0ABP4BUR5_9ACTN
MFRFLALDRMQTRLHRWRLDLRTGQCREERLSDSITEFGVLNNTYGGRRHRYTYAASGVDGWFLFNGLVKHDLLTGGEERFTLPEGVYGSEPAMAPRVGGTAEDDGYLVTLTTDMNEDRSECLIFDAARPADGPLALGKPSEPPSGRLRPRSGLSMTRRSALAASPCEADTARCGPAGACRVRACAR